MVHGVNVVRTSHHEHTKQVLGRLVVTRVVALQRQVEPLIDFGRPLWLPEDTLVRLSLYQFHDSAPDCSQADLPSPYF